MGSGLGDMDPTECFLWDPQCFSQMSKTQNGQPASDPNQSYNAADSQPIPSRHLCVVHPKTELKPHSWQKEFHLGHMLLLWGQGNRKA